jgi:soluble calcium-activated nucleotidase 1
VVARRYKAQQVGGVTYWILRLGPSFRVLLNYYPQHDQVGNEQEEDSQEKNPWSLRTRTNLKARMSRINGPSPSKVLRKIESAAYPTSPMDVTISKLTYHARQNSKFVAGAVATILVIMTLTLPDGSPGRLRGVTSTIAKKNYANGYTWGGAMHPGYFNVEDSYITPPNTPSSTMMWHFAALTDLDQLSKVESATKPTWESHILPGVLKRTGLASYEIVFSDSEYRSLQTQHNEAGRGAEFSELTLYDHRLLTFDDRTGEVFEILNDTSGQSSRVVPRFIITEGDGDEAKGMKWEWSTVKDDELYIGSMGKEFSNAEGEIVNEHNLWIGIIDQQGRLRKENWKENYLVVRKALAVEFPGYYNLEAMRWSEHMHKWVFLPRRISSERYDEVKDERLGGNKIVLVDEFFKTTQVVTMAKLDMNGGLRGFSSFAFVPGSKDRHALAIRSVEEDCTGDLDSCKQRSYALVFDIESGAILSDEVKFKDNYKFEGLEFVDLSTKPKK